MIAGNGFANALESIFGTSVKSISGGFALHVRDETFTPEGWSSDVYDTGSFTIHAFDLTAGADIRQLFAFADQSSHLSDAIAAFADTYADTLLDSLRQALPVLGSCG